MKLWHSVWISLFLFSMDVHGSWSSPISLYSNQEVTAPVVGVDSSGNATFIVSAFDSEFSEETGQLIQGVVSNLNSYLQLGGSRYLGNQSISVSSNGNAALAWIEQDSGDIGFARAALLLNNIWESPTSLTSTANDNVTFNSSVGLNMSSSNEALFAWIDRAISGGEYQVHWNLYANGVWGSLSTIPGTISSDFLTSLAVSGNASGQAMAIWLDQALSVLQGSVFNGTSWISTNLSISTDVDTSYCVVLNEVSMNALGNAILLWANAGGGVSAMTYIDGNYGTEQIISLDGSSSVSSVAVAFSDNGGGVAVWTSEKGSTSFVYASRYTNGSWSSVFILDSITGGYSGTYGANVGVDAYGNALAVWEKSDTSGNSGVYYAISNVDSGSNNWTDLATLLSSDSTSSSPFLSMNTSGNATVVWSISDSGPQTAQAVYTESSLFSPVPPQDFQGNQIKNKFPMQIELVNSLRWKASPSENVVFYRLFRNGVQIATISSSSPLIYQDQGFKRGLVYTYQLVAVNSNGYQSLPVTVILP